MDDDMNGGADNMDATTERPVIATIPVKTKDSGTTGRF